MKVAIGLPNAVPGTSGEQLTEWARRAEARGFSSLGTIDRVAYPNLEPLVSLAAAAAVTERIGLATTVLLGPLRRNPVALAKQVAEWRQGFEAYLTDYYAWLGDEVAGYAADSAAKDAETVKGYISAFETFGCQELFLFPSSSDPQQVDLLADALGM